MLVKLKHNWFAPSEPWNKQDRNLSTGANVMNNPVSGQMYRRGVVEMPEHLRSKLPSSAIVLDEHEIPEEVKHDVSIKDFDETRLEALFEEKAISDKTVKRTKQPKK